MIILQEEKRNQLSRDYTATVLGMIGRTLAGEAWSMRPYIEMAYPELDQVDTRTAEEIKNDLLRKLTG